MRLHRCLAEDELLGELGVGETASEQTEDLPLALRQRRDGCTGLVRLLGVGETLQQSRCNGRAEQRIAVRDQPDRVDEIGGTHVFEQEAARARTDGGIDVFVEVERGQDEDPRRAAGRDDLSRGLDPVETGHADVHQDHVRLELPCEAHGVFPVLGLAHDLEVGTRLDDQREAAAHERLIVDDQHPDAHDASPSGICARTTYPPSAAEPIRTEPPSRATRSRIPIRPLPPESPLLDPPPSSRISRLSSLP